MSATVFYDSTHEQATITASFKNSSGVAADPTTITCVVTDPAGNQVTHTYQGGAPADITKLSTGNYQLAVTCSPSVANADGLWSFTFIGTGAVEDVQPGTWRVFPLNIGTWYVGLEELKDRLGIVDSTDDSTVQRAIQSASSWVNEWCGRHFYQVTETRTYQPTNIWVIDVDDIVSVSSVAVDVDGDGVFETNLVQGTDFQLRLALQQYNVNAAGVPRPYTQLQIINSGQIWPFTWPYTHLDRVKITGTWGWPIVPPPVAEATMVLAADFFKLKDAPFGIAGMSDFGAVKVQSNPWIVEALRPFVKGRRKVGC